MIGVYKITSPTGKVYIGSSIDIEKRIKHYKSVSCKKQTKLFNSIQKHSWENHLFEVICECDLENLYRLERFYGDMFNVLGVNGLNLILPKNNEIKIGVSEETRNKMSNAKLGEKNTFYGKTHSLSAREKISKYQIGRKHTPEHREKVSKNNAKNLSKIVVDIQSGVFYESAKEVSDLYGIKHSTLRSMLNGTNKNKTSFTYCL